MQLKRPTDNLLADFPMILCVCRGVEFTFMRVTMTEEISECVKLGLKHAQSIRVGRWWIDAETGGRGFSFTTKEDFEMIMLGLACCKQILDYPSDEIILKRER
jgi:hypothetical protein